MILSGLHTLDETRELLAVADYRFAETEKAINEALEKKQLTPDNDITKDWILLIAKWKAAREEISSALRNKGLMAPLAPASIIATEAEWKRILGFVQYQENEKGSLQDIYHRLYNVTGKQVDFSKQPAQVAVDLDMRVLKTADTGIKKGEAASAAVKKEAGEIITSNTGLIIGGTILGTLAVVTAAKIYLR